MLYISILFSCEIYRSPQQIFEIIWIFLATEQKTGISYRYISYWKYSIALRLMRIFFHIYIFIIFFFIFIFKNINIRRWKIKNSDNFRFSFLSLNVFNKLKTTKIFDLLISHFIYVDLRFTDFSTQSLDNSNRQ